MKRPGGIDHHPRIRRSRLAPATSHSWSKARRNPNLRSTYIAEWTSGQRRIGLVMLLPAILSGWLTWMLLSDPGQREATGTVVQVMLALPASGIGLASLVSIMRPMWLFWLSHEDRDETKRRSRQRSR